MTENPDTHPETPLRKASLRSFVRWFLIGVALLWSLAVLILVAARWIDPPTTTVHMERRLQAWIHHRSYHERYEFVPLSQISPDFQHAVIAAEDARFYQHHGFDWDAIQIAAEGDMEGSRIRGGSTLTQQLIKNLFFGRTDFILSAEIIVITLGTVAATPFVTQVSVLTGVALIMTVGVYGLVAGIVKLDDGGLFLSQRPGDVYSARVLRAFGAGVLKVAPWLMKGLSLAGTAAMFLVGGGILTQGIPGLHPWIKGLADGMAAAPGVGGALQWLALVLLDAVAGILAGALVLAVVSGARRVVRPETAA